MERLPPGGGGEVVYRAHSTILSAGIFGTFSLLAALFSSGPLSRVRGWQEEALERLGGAAGCGAGGIPRNARRRRFARLRVSARARVPSHRQGEAARAAGGGGAAAVARKGGAVSCCVLLERTGCSC